MSYAHAAIKKKAKGMTIIKDIDITNYKSKKFNPYETNKVVNIMPFFEFKGV